MSLEKEKMTAPCMSVAADKEQSIAKITNVSLIEKAAKCNEEIGMDELQEYMRRMSDPNYLHTVSLTELYDTSFRPKTQIIEGFLCSGVYLFAGAPKVGKSFFVAQLGYHVSAGLPLWDYPISQGAVLYLALEDDYARLQKRLSRMFGMDGDNNFFFATQAKNLKEGLDGQLTAFVREHPDTKLIIIDTLQRIREVGGDKYSYASDYEIVALLKKFTDQHNICILVVHHTRKQGSEDSFDTISGTNGLLGAADGAFIMQKTKRTDNNAVLDVVGRDQQDQRLHLLFDRERCLWMLTEKETELWKEPPNPLLAAIAGLLTPTIPEWLGSASDLIDRLDGMEVQPNVLMRKLNVNADRLWNEYGIQLKSIRTHEGRLVRLTLETPKEEMG